MANDMFAPDPTSLMQVHHKLKSNKYYWPYFKRFTDTIDGIYVTVIVSGRELIYEHLCDMQFRHVVHICLF